MNKKIRLFFKKIIPQIIVKKAREKNTLIKWYFNNQPIPAPDSIKQKIVGGYGKKNNLKTFIETGTAGGLMIKAIGKNFDKIISIELDDFLFKNAKENFANNKNVTLIHGDSGEKLVEILPKINEPSLFWLDAHYSGEGTAKGEYDTPIIKELLTIFSRKNKRDIILIDDARCFDGTHDYPTVQQIKDLVGSYDYLSFKIERDIMVIQPKY